MNFNFQNKIIIIHGRQNDRLSSLPLKDICFLNLETMNWIHPEYNGDELLGRTNHVSFIIEGQLIIFGGVAAEKILNFDFTLFDIDFFNKN